MFSLISIHTSCSPPAAACNVCLVDSNSPALFLFRGRSTSLWTWGPRRRAPSVVSWQNTSRTWWPRRCRGSPASTPSASSLSRLERLYCCFSLKKNKHPTLELRQDSVCFWSRNRGYWETRWKWCLGICYVFDISWKRGGQCFFDWKSLHYSSKNVRFEWHKLVILNM